MVDRSTTGCIRIPNKIWEDDRGHFTEVFNANAFFEHTKLDWFAGKQVNFSYSYKNVVRGMHFQRGIHAQAKFVRVLKGSIIDVVIDLDQLSKTFGEMETFHLTPVSYSLYVPNTHAHGFWALEDTEFIYVCDRAYAPSAESGINPLDTSLPFPWLADTAANPEELILAPKDRAHPKFRDVLLGL